ncbi:MAG: hypothetical protein OEN02_08975 [Gammaproteobacteria bacterium]|nr:hypothetical protein [Gammaproteobacteria bacterium]MDH3536306.1 hypothetical protein [Gammaproteobacteria bacterium]
MTKFRIYLPTLLAILAIAGFQVASAATITITLGNDTPGFSDGSVPPLIPQILGAQSGQPAPFDVGKGSDLFANLSESWTFNYGAIADPITAATLTLGIVDHDSAATGSQVGSFSIDGNDLTGVLDAAFETGGGSADGEYNVYSLSLGASTLLDLLDGSALVNLALAGPGLQTALFGGAVSETANNGAHLIFSTLSIETAALPAIPIPAAAPLFATALALFGLYRRRVQRKDV